MKQVNASSRTLLMRGIDALSRREYSRQELNRKLIRYLNEGETADDVENVLDILEEKGYLSNERYAQSRVRVRALRYGNRRLTQELSMMGIDRETITEALLEIPDEFERAQTIWEKRYGEAPKDRKEYDRQLRFLVSRGFGFDIIHRVVQPPLAEDVE